MQTLTMYKLDQEFDILQASLEDAEIIYNLIKDTAHWIGDKKINQWRHIVEGGGYSDIQDAIMYHETFKVIRNGELCATFSLNYTQNNHDIKLWGISDEDAVYLHKLAVSRHMIGKGLGRKMVDWAQEYIKSQGKMIFRLDCVAINPKLVDFYTKCGLENQGTVHGHVKFQKNLQVL